jgi:hypothetical protein
MSSFTPKFFSLGLDFFSFTFTLWLQAIWIIFLFKKSNPQFENVSSKFWVHNSNTLVKAIFFSHGCMNGLHKITHRWIQAFALDVIRFLWHSTTPLTWVVHYYYQILESLSYFTLSWRQWVRILEAKGCVSKGTYGRGKAGIPLQEWRCDRRHA